MQAVDLNQDPRVLFAAYVSFGVNVFLLIVNCIVAGVSGSLALLASAIDSLMDIISQIVVFMAARKIRNVDRSVWPVGRSRLEPLGIVVVAAMMAVASLFVIVQAIIKLVESASSIRSGAAPDQPHLTEFMQILFSCAIGCKVFLYFYCVRFRNQSDMCKVLAEDHRNDVLNNTTALVCASVASAFQAAWFLDSVGAILISLYVIHRWYGVGQEHAGMLVGKTASPEIIAQVKAIATAHDASMAVDVVRVYHFGTRFLVEVEVVMPIETPLETVHDRSLALQKRIEELDLVERAHVHGASRPVPHSCTDARHGSGLRVSQRRGAQDCRQLPAAAQRYCRFRVQRARRRHACRAQCDRHRAHRHGAPAAAGARAVIVCVCILFLENAFCERPGSSTGAWP